MGHLIASHTTLQVVIDVDLSAQGRCTGNLLPIKDVKSQIDFILNIEITKVFEPPEIVIFRA